MINKKQIILIVISFILLVGLLSVIYYIQQNSNQIKISGFDKYAKSIPEDRKKSLYQSLYVQISDDGKLDNYRSDAIIRENSFSEKYKKDSNIYNSAFIIDIPSIKESFKVNISWSPDSNVNLGPEDLTFSCLEKSEIIYKNFDCNKSLGLPDLIENDITQYLPYSVSNYMITLKNNSDIKTSLYIDIYLDRSDTENNKTNNSIDKYKQSAINWIKSKNLNPDNYIINYRTHGN